MKARVKKLGKCLPRQWVDIHTEYDVVELPKPCVGPAKEKYQTEFRIFLNKDHPNLLLYQYNGTSLGGSGSEWELIDDDDTNNAYDRAMGVL